MAQASARDQRVAAPQALHLAHTTGNAGVDHRINAARFSTTLLFVTSAVFSIASAVMLATILAFATADWRGVYLSLLVILVASVGGAAAQRSRPRIAENGASIAIAGIGLGLLALSSLWVREGTPFSAYFLVVFVFGALALTGVRPERLLPLALTLLGLDAAGAYLHEGWTTTAHLTLLGDATAALVGTATSLRLKQLYHHDWVRTREALEDPLTGLSNRRAFQRSGEQMLAHARREQRPVTLALIDIDRFKRVNDEFGHAAGDAALKSIADSLRRVARRPLDCVVRLGGDEFAVLWYDLDETEARRRCAGLVKEIATKSLQLAGQNARHPSVSLGSCTERGANVDLSDLQRRADQALYEVKRHGGNAARMAPATSTLPAEAKPKKLRPAR
jgi:diguanylate cyclase (GGDEF)-like protein